MKLGIIGAMDFEVALLIEQMTNVEVKEIAGLQFNCGQISDVDCVVVVSGIGKVNGAMCAQILISEFSVSHLLNTGVAGAIAPEINLGDVVISTDVMEHDMDLTGDGLEYGEIPRMETSVFVADQKLRELAYKAAKNTLKNYQVLEGRIVSGDVFVSDSERKKFIYQQFSAKLTEMEGAAIGHVCYLNKIPFVIIRAASDTADDKAELNYYNFFDDAAKRSVAIVMAMLAEL